MSEKMDRDDGAARGTARRRARFSSGSGGDRFSRPVLAAMIVILAGGAYLFWPRGGGAPTGIGEQLTVVTADSAQGEAPRSGSVEIEDQVQPIVPEKPAGAAVAEQTRTPEPAAPERQPEPEPESAPEPARTPPRQSAGADRPKPTTPPRTVEAAKPRIVPRPSGAWAVQLGAFQDEANAQQLVTELSAKGVIAHVRAAGTSSGDIVFRVWVGWFTNRQDALDYGVQERRIIGDSYPVHR